MSDIAATPPSDTASVRDALAGWLADQRISAPSEGAAYWWTGLFMVTICTAGIALPITAFLAIKGRDFGRGWAWNRHMKTEFPAMRTALAERLRALWPRPLRYLDVDITYRTPSASDQVEINAIGWDGDKLLVAAAGEVHALAPAEILSCDWDAPSAKQIVVAEPSKVRGVDSLEIETTNATLRLDAALRAGLTIHTLRADLPSIRYRSADAATLKRWSALVERIRAGTMPGEVAA